MRCLAEGAAKMTYKSYFERVKQRYERFLRTVYRGNPLKPF